MYSAVNTVFKIAFVKESKYSKNDLLIHELISLRLRKGVSFNPLFQ